MRVAIISDIHDNVWNLANALSGLTDCDVLLCCGDLCSPFVVAQLGDGFNGPVHFVFGNNDGDLFRITAVAGRFDHVHIHGEVFQGEIGGKRFAVNHYPNLARPMAQSNQFDVVCYGHNHIFRIEEQSGTILVNPGTIMGFDPSQRQDIPATLAIYDTESNQAEGYQILRGGASPTGKLMPYEG